MKEQNPPAGWIYRPLAFLCRVVSRLLFRLEVEESGDIPREGPLLLLSSHQGMVDFILLIAALRGRRIRFVATQRQFRNPKLHWAYVRLRMIPKVQFHTDPRCVMGILRALKNGGTVGIFPAGQTSMCGTPEGMTPSVAHLVKKAGVPVCTASIHGGFFTWPRFGHGWNRGRTQVRLRLAFSPEELKALPEEEIYEKIVRDLDYDDYAWQEETGARFSGKHRAGGYGDVLIRCPKCGKWGAMADRGNRVFCRSCGNGGTVGEDMRIRPDSGESRVFPTLKEWYAWQGEGIELPLTSGPGASALTRRPLPTGTPGRGRSPSPKARSPIAAPWRGRRPSSPFPSGTCRGCPPPRGNTWSSITRGRVFCAMCHRTPPTAGG